MSQADDVDTSPEQRKANRSSRNRKPLPEGRRAAAESSLRMEQEEWRAKPAPEFLTRSDTSDEKAGPGPDPHADDEPVTIELTTEPARASKKGSRSKSMPIASYALYAALFVATAAISAAAVLFVM